MAKGLSYADAVRLLGGRDSKIVTALDKITGGLLLAVAVAGAPALLAWLEARAEFARLSQDLVREFTARRSGLSRYSRTQRLEAAHSVLVVAAYFEALADTDLPFRFRDLELTKAEQVGMADLDHRLDTNATSMVPALLDLAQNHLPEPQQAYEGLLAWLERSFYPSLSSTITQFIRGPLALEAVLAHGQLAGQPFAAAHARALRRRRERFAAHAGRHRAG